MPPPREGAPQHVIAKAFFLVTGQQGQGNMQLLVNIHDFLANVQAAGDAAHFNHNQAGYKLRLETEHFKIVSPQLIDAGHSVSSSNGSPMVAFEGITSALDPTTPMGRAATDARCTLPIAVIFRDSISRRDEPYASAAVDR